MIYVYEKNGVVYVGDFLDDNKPDVENYITPQKLPNEPIESWYIDDGQIKIDQEKLTLYNRSQMPTLSPVEFDLKLNKYGLYGAVQQLVDSDLNLRIAYTRATFFSRTDPFIDQARQLLNLTDEQVDEMWMN